MPTTQQQTQPVGNELALTVLHSDGRETAHQCQSADEAVNIIANAGTAVAFKIGSSPQWQPLAAPAANNTSQLFARAAAAGFGQQSQQRRQEPLGLPGGVSPVRNYGYAYEQQRQQRRLQQQLAINGGNRGQQPLGLPQMDFSDYGATKSTEPVTANKQPGVQQPLGLPKMEF